MVNNGKRRRGMGLISLLSDWLTIFKSIRSIRNWVKYRWFPSIVYYIAPTVAHNDYYARLQIALETEIDNLGKDVWWRYCPPRGKTPSHMYQRLEEVLKEIRPCDLIVMVPKELHDDQTQTRVRKWLTKYPSARIVFLDQPPPEGFVHRERCSFVGVDNRKVGIMAAFALHERLAEADEYKYCVVEGPGGGERLAGFVEGVRSFDSETHVDRFDIGDMDRLESWEKITTYLKDYPAATSIGIFAGNDETATAVLWALRHLSGRNAGNAFVVGCDATREMRLIVCDPNTCAIATIDTKLGDQAHITIQAIQEQVHHFQEPKLNPGDLDIKFKKLLELKPEFAILWEKAR